MTRYHNKKILRCGYTTGTCAAAAAKAAARALLTGVRVESEQLLVPKGELLTIPIEEHFADKASARCAVRKFSGDDPDITNGVLVFAEVTRCQKGVIIHGGEGVGRVTRPGLDMPVGAAAINSVPRKMIEREVLEVCAPAGYSGGLAVTISIPGGTALAAKTFNPKLGIVGGLSILGTSGIVEPMSSKAVADTIRLEIKALAAGGENKVILVIGNFGSDFARNVLNIRSEHIIKCSNFLGDALDAAAAQGFSEVLIIGHIGKLVKLGIGALNTHSAEGDGRIETLVSCALDSGADIEILRALSACVTTDAALEVLRHGSVLRATMDELAGRIADTLSRRTPDTMNTSFICFSGEEILFSKGNF